jgi:conjugative transposon TraM protein
MKENKKKVCILTDDGGQNKASHFPDEKKSMMEKIKKPLIFGLMGIVFTGCMYLIFKPSSDKNQTQNIGLNDSVPQPSEAIMQADKQKAYEMEILEQKEQQKRSDLTTLSDYWNEESSQGKEAASDQADQSIGYTGSTSASGNPAVNSYRNAQSAVGSFYQDDNGQTEELRRQLEELKEKLAEKEIPIGVTAADQLALMEKSYQMAAKYLPSTANSGETANTKSSTPATSKVVYFESFVPAKKSGVSALYQKPADSSFLSNWSSEGKHSFHTAGSLQQALQPKNSVKACVEQTQTIIGESIVRLRLLEPAQTPGRTIPPGTILTANAKIQAGRLQLKVTSMEVDGSIITVDVTIYDLDGQQGLYVPYSPEMNALSEMAGNMSQTSGTSLMLTQSAGQQMAADLSRGVVQGISGYFSKKVRTPKVIIKAGHQLYLVSKKQ